MNLTDEQIIAVTNNDKSICISAGAGSGKTRVLVEKFWYLLELGHEVDELLAITFTRKAAQEMQERIRERLKESDLECAQKRAINEALNNAWIGTIDGICSRIIREYPVEAGIDPFFDIVEEVTINQLRYKLARELIIEGIRNQEEAVLAYVKEFGYQRLINDILSLLSIMIGKGLDLAYIKSLTLDNIQQITQELNDLVSMIESLADSVIESLPEIGIKTKTYAAVEIMSTNKEEWLKALHNLASLEYSREDFKSIELLYINRPANIVKDDLKEIQVLLDKFISIIAEYNNRHYLQTLFDMTDKLEKRLDRAKSEQNILEYGDLINKVIKLLQDYPEVNLRFGKQFQHIMVDEFQDTNYRQVELVEILSNNYAIPVFAVGDPKQSIYRFRGAEVGLFAKTSRDIVEKGGLDSQLSTNFRTRQNLIELVNSIFSDLMSASNIGFQPLVAHRPKHTEEFAEIHLINQDTPSLIELDEAEAYCIVSRIKEIIDNQEIPVYEKVNKEENSRHPRYSDIAILFQKSKNMEITINVLKEYGIPYYVVGSSGFFDTEEVNNIILFLKVINNEFDNKSSVGLLRSQMFGVSDEALWYLKQKHEVLTEGLLYVDKYVDLFNSPDNKALALAQDLIFYLRANKSRLSLTEIISFMIDRTDYAQFLAQQANGEQQLINLQKLLTITKDKEMDYINNIKEFLDYIEGVKLYDQRESQAVLDSEASNTVKLMTVHQAKGLEFPIVILPFLHQTFNTSDISDKLLFSNDLGLFLRTDPKGYLRILAEEEELELIMEEYMRIFYVAQTRACDYLILSAAYNIKEEKDGTIIPEANRNSWLKWLFDYFQVTQIPPDIHFQEKNIRPYLYNSRDIEEIIARNIDMTGESEGLLHTGEYVFNYISTYNKPTSISATRLLDYKFCPFFAYLKYDKGLSMGLSTEQVKVEYLEDLDAANRGIIIHEIIENADRLDEAEKLLAEKLNQMGVKITDSEENLMLAMLKNYYENEFLKTMDQGGRKLKEVPFISRIDDTKYAYGLVDQLHLEKDFYHILDLKTGGFNEDYAIQLNFYSKALDKILSQELKSKAILYLANGKTELVDDQMVNFNILDEPQPEWTISCNLCTYRTICFPEL